MNINKMGFSVFLSALLAMPVAGFGQAVSTAGTDADVKDEIEQVTKAANVFREIMSAPDKAIPQTILDEADCVAVFPSVIKAAFGVGGSGGRGVVSCRSAKGWSAPAYLNVGGGSFGAQIGVESTDYVMLFMTPEGARSLLETNVKLGGSVSIAAGPVGRQAGAATDAKLNAAILSYSRSKGLFAGAALEGAVIETAGGDMRDVYGANISSKTVLFDSTVTAPAPMMAFAKTLETYSPAATSGK
jgi:lipid-binding SYLF domain-containing protein